jgi:hypothetical protein
LLLLRGLNPEGVPAPSATIPGESSDPRPTVALVIASALPEGLALPVIDVNPRVTSVEVETQLPGGFGLCRVGMLPPDLPRPAVYPYLPMPVEVQDRSHIAVHVGGSVVHEGVLQETDEPGGRVHGLSSLGYGLAGMNWGVYESAGSDLTTSGAIVRDVIRQAAPLLSLAVGDGFVDPGVRHAWSEYDGRTPAEVLDQLTREGGGDENTPWLFTVYEDRALRFLPQVTPSQAIYRVPVDERMRIRRSLGHIVDAARMSYQDADGEEAYTPWFYRAGVDRSSPYLRRRTLSGSAETAAIQFVQTWLRENSAARLAVSLTLSDWDELELVGGGRRPGYLVRASEPAEIEGYGIVFITRTQANLSTGQVSIQLGDLMYRSLGSLLTRLQETDSAARTGRSAVTGARSR